MSCVRAFEQFDWLAPSDAAEKLKSIRLSSTCVAERLEAILLEINNANITAALLCAEKSALWKTGLKADFHSIESSERTGNLPAHERNCRFEFE